MKKIVLCFITIVSFFILTSCGNNSYIGTYELDYYRYVGDPSDVKNTGNSSIILDDDGVGTINRDGLNINITWEIDDENISIVELSSDNGKSYYGTIKDDKLDLFDGDKENPLTNELVYIKK